MYEELSKIFIEKKYYDLIKLFKIIPRTTKIKPIKLIVVGSVSLKKIIPPNTVNTTSPDWIDSITAN